ncbi:MAG: TetR/AcrR family transcriptional regulator [Lachnospiraceae bacterium]|nr:TetR/AcrR family transcriptional regulator [Lachnospiraceae bacterium]
MPRDKSGTYTRIMKAAKEAFLKNGFEKTSIRDIASDAGVTSAALYRHCKDKEELFCMLVEPAITALTGWVDNHIKVSYEGMERGDYKGIKSQSEIDLIRNVGIPYKTEFKLLIEKSSGTRYEHFMHYLVEEHEKKMWQGLKDIASYGYKVKNVSREELHILVSAYMTALFEPIIHDFENDKIEHYLETVAAFFMPGWHELLGV